eukprot:TRINITY_DN12719_c0_g1_i2.p1 TRINITY_DN12719_c0_g1~~TRINITY_DN12719_c0_g1_i2.p1  ORF type:complete len:342 (+),score=118.04 TRINITY_DN12719_c0_g1_i2:15-1040(+)
MSNKITTSVAQVGDLVLLFESVEKVHSVTLVPKAIFNNKFGSFHHDSIIGTPYGSKVFEKKNRGWLVVLKPTPELWTNAALAHQTQILYTVDVGSICFQLDLLPGCIVVESGTGSGSLTMGMARAVAPTGHINTFEFHENRSQIARELFAKNGLESHITVRHRDACAEGFSPLAKPTEDAIHSGGPADASVDAVVLDLPRPWLALKSAARVLKIGGRICSFSPCIEQVGQTTTSLRSSAMFGDIVTLEVLARTYEGSLPFDKVAELNEGEQEFNPEAEALEHAAGGKKRKAEKILPPHLRKLRRNDNRTVTLRPETDIRGHTGYLTFATKQCAEGDWEQAL